VAHVFFTSYAKLDNNKTSRLADVIELVRERVRSRVGGTADEVGFFDSHALQPGVNWKLKMGNALSQARVLVCFCSNTYFNREFCAKEFEVFRQRMAGNPALGEDAKFILPVIWDKCQLPQAVGRFQLDHGTFPKEYVEDGLMSLKRVLPKKYLKAVDALVDAIIAAWNGPALPPWGQPIDFDAMAASFDNPGPYENVRLAVLHPQGLQWSVEPGRTVRFLMEDAATSLRAPWKELRALDDVVARLEKASQDREAVLVLTDQTSAKAAPWSVRLAAIDAAIAEKPLRNCAILVGYSAAPNFAAPNPASAAEMEATLRALLPQSSDVSSLNAWFPMADTRVLSDRLRSCATKVRMSLIAKDACTKVESAELTEAARREGIPTESRPIVSGPTS